ncbi:MAG: universal stress protein, partial [Candidatus Thiodiazotropha sp. (ex Rostrolucina anterorostrata)]|nr:universal stress protein [Candidatus Thiodiazotropha sp. (ex Rostrolucina anterorostrata)]
GCFDVSQQQINQIRRFYSISQTPDSVITQFCEDTMDNNEASHYVSYDVIVDMGEPGDRIIEHAQSGGYDLVVIGKRGRGILQGGLMGDTARRVIRHCKVPVLVVSIPSE